MIRITLRDVCHVNRHLFYGSQKRCIFAAFYIHLKKTRVHTLVCFFAIQNVLNVETNAKQKKNQEKMVTLFISHSLWYFIPLQFHFFCTALCPVAHSMRLRDSVTNTCCLIVKIQMDVTSFLYIL